MAAARVLEIGGKTYHVSPLTAKQWGEHIGWLKDEWFSTIKRNVADLEPGLRDSLLTETTKKLGLLAIDDPELVAIAGSPAGVFRIVRLHLLARHPDISEEDVADLLNSTELQQLALDRIAETEQTGGGSNGTPKKQTRRKTKKARQRTGTKSRARRKKRSR